MADYGINKRFQRAKVRLQVLIGFNPTEPVKLSSLAAPATNVSIKSGQALVKDSSGNFVLATEADNATQKSVYIALHDSDDMDVQASGKLVGLDCSDTFEVQTGYFTPADQVWALDDAVTVANGGLFAKAASGDLIVGRITAIGAGGAALTSGGLTPSASDTKVIQFKTTHSGAAKA